MWETHVTFIITKEIKMRYIEQKGWLFSPTVSYTYYVASEMQTCESSVKCVNLS